MTEYEIPDEPMDIHGELLKAVDRIRDLEAQNALLREALEECKSLRNIPYRIAETVDNVLNTCAEGSQNADVPHTGNGAIGGGG